MPQRCATLAILLAALFVRFAAAQQREPIVGTATTATGAPWADAEVVLLLPTHPEHPGLGVQDRVVVRTDASGRFRAEGLVGRTYSLYAHDRDTQGRRRASSLAVANAAIAVALQARSEPRPPTHFRLRETAAHTQHGPLYVQWSFPHDQLQPVPADGALEIPVATDTYLTMQITRTDGALVLSSLRYAHDDQDESLPPPSPVLLRALDGPGGTPVADAEFRIVDEGRHFVLGRTDAAGYAEVDACALRRGERFADLRLRLRAFAAGRQAGLVHEVDAKLLTAEARAALRATGGSQAFTTLPKTRPLPGRLWLAPGKPAAHVPIVVQARAQVSHMRGASMSRLSTWLTTTDAEGHYRVDHHTPNAKLQVIAMLPLALAQHWPGVATTCIPLWNRPEGGANSEPAALDDVVLSEVATLRLALREPAGGVAMGGAVQLQLAGVQTRPPTLLADRRGTITLALPAAVPLELAIAGNEGSWLGRLRGGFGPDATLSLWTDRTVVCRVRDAEGRSVAAELDAWLQTAPVEWQPPAANTDVVVPLPASQLVEMVAWLPKRIRRGPDGDWLLTVPDLPMPWIVRASDRNGRGATATFQAGAAVEPLELRF